MSEIKGGDDFDKLQQYVSIIEAPQPETPAVWSGFETLKLNATVEDGQTVLLQETYDPAWRAYENGKPLHIHQDHVMGFMLIDLAPGTHSIDMRFETPLENRIGQFELVISLLIVGGLAVKDRKWRAVGEQPSPESEAASFYADANVNVAQTLVSAAP